MSRRPLRTSYQAIAATEEEDSFNENDHSVILHDGIPENEEVAKESNHKKNVGSGGSSSIAYSSIAGSSYSWWLANSPRGNPHLWHAINGTCLLASLWLLVELLYYSDPDREDETYRLVPFYAMYNFITTILWCIEDGLCLFYEWTMLWTSSSSRHRRMNMAMLLVHGVLLVAALHFLVTSILFFAEMTDLFDYQNMVVSSATTAEEEDRSQQRPEPEIARMIMDEITRDVFTSLLIYLLALLYVCLVEVSRRRRHNNRRRKHRGDADHDDNVQCDNNYYMPVLTDMCTSEDDDEDNKSSQYQSIV
jgi:hypothetical protein